MSKNSFARTIAVLLTVTLIAPSAFFVAPQKSLGYPVTVVAETSPTAAKRTKSTIISAIKETLSEMHNLTTSISTYAQKINTYILQPLAFVMSGKLLKSMTAGVIGFVNGKANGTGAPQFARDVLGIMQKVQDMQASSFLNQFSTNSNSPFKTSIVSALRKDYLQSSSLSGFFAANKCTLTESSSDVNGFLAGDWSKGGVTAWFALTTQDQNNPYTLYMKSQSQLSSLMGSGVGGATGARLAELSWGKGFMSWCGATDSESSGTESNDNVSCKTSDDCTSGYCEYDDLTGESTCRARNGVSPGDPCTQSDGLPGKIKTPGSVISATLDKVLGSTQDKLVQMGSLAKEVNGIMSDITKIMQTVNIASNILGGSGGLFGADTSSDSDFLGVSTSTVSEGNASSTASASGLSKRITKYESFWNTIKASADTASTSVNNLIKTCTDNAAVVGASATFKAAATAQANAAQTVLNGAIATVFANFKTASTMIAAARAALENVDTYSTDDLQELQTMSPTADDVAYAQEESTQISAATANPDGSLTVSGGSIVDRMDLIGTNAATLKTTVCDPSSSTYVTN